MPTIGIRREDKNSWERRAPLTPNAVATLATEGVQTQLQRSSNRVFSDAAYESCGAFLVDDPFDADLVLAIKEIPAELLRKGGSYLFFSHTIKGQPCNMGLLKRLIELGCNLFDYECITNEQGQRLVFFGHHAGMAGMLDTLWACGQRLKALGHAATPFADLLPAHRYDGLTEIKQAVATAGDIIRTEGLPTSLALPLVCGFTGYGNVSQGAQYIWDQLPSEEITPSQLAALTARTDAPRDRVFKVVFHEEHLVERTDGATFALQDYYENPADYRSIFGHYAPHLSMILNGIYWTKDYPRLLPRSLLNQLLAKDAQRLLVIGDVSCDIDGAVQATVKATEPDEPVFIYDPARGSHRNGFAGPGVAVMAVDNLPCELPKEATEHFSAALLPFVSRLARTDFSRETDDLNLPAPLRRALILHRGRFTPEFEYMQAFL